MIIDQNLSTSSMQTPVVERVDVAVIQSNGQLITASSGNNQSLLYNYVIS